MTNLRYTIFSLFMVACTLLGCQEEPALQEATLNLETDNQEGKSLSASNSRDASWELVWSDEFDFFDGSKWTKIDAPSSINNDLTYLTPNNVWTTQQWDSKQNQNISVLRIRADDENAAGGKPYGAGKVVSKGKFDMLYGRVEVRVRTGNESGSHTAAWLLNAPCDGVNPCASWPPEIDILEVVGLNPAAANFNVHYGVQSPTGRWSDQGQGITYDNASRVAPAGAFNTVLSPIPGNAFYEYAIEWESDEIRWYVDGVEKASWNPNNSTSYMPNERMFLILDMVIGGDWPGTPVNDNIKNLNDYADFDYVRVYKRGTPPPSGSGNVKVRARGTAGGEQLKLKVDGSTVQTWNLTTSMSDYYYSGNVSGKSLELRFDDNSGQDVQVDYLEADGTVYQAEAQSVNTGVWQNGGCGGGFSEYIHCPGEIKFGSTGGGSSNTVTVRARGTINGGIIRLLVDDSEVANWTMSTSMSNYTYSGSVAGKNVKVQFDDNIGDAVIDYVQVGSTTRQAESRGINTGAWQGTCGGGSFTESIDCPGYIDFGSF
jgi:beta-glucanase (GH16 family)